LKRQLIIFLLALMSFSTYAETNTDKVKVLMEAQGLLELWKTQIESGKVQSEKLGQQALGQITSQLTPNEEFKKRFSDAYKNYMDKVVAPWTAQEIVDVWAKYYGPNFTEEELDKLIEFYTSALGKKDVAATKLAMVQFTEHFQREIQPIFAKATKEYIEELKIVASECKCDNKKSVRSPRKK
jgi:hypothetical protein